MQRKEKAGFIVALAGLVLVVMLGLVSVHVPFGRDQGVAAFVAKVMARGGDVYKDVYHFNLPGIFFTYRLVAGFTQPQGVNVLHVVFTALTYIFVYAGARRIMSPLSSAFAALFYGAFAIVMYTDYWDIAQKESLACLPLSIAMLCNFQVLDYAIGGHLNATRRRTLAAAALAGAFSGLAAHYKPTLGIVLLSILYPAWLSRKDMKKAGLMLAWAAGGFLLSFLPLFIYLVAKGLLPEMLESVFRFGGFYAGQYYEGLIGSSWKAAGEVIRWLYRWRFLSVLAIVGALSFRRQRETRLVALFAGLLLLQVIIQMKFFTYHWVPLLLPASMLAAAGGSVIISGKERASLAERLTNTAPFSPHALVSGRRAPRYAVLLVLAALFAGNLGPYATRYKREVFRHLGKISQEQFLKSYGRWGSGDICPLAQRATATYIRRNTRPDEPLLVVGHELGLYLMTGLFPPTRFAYDQPLVTDPRGEAGFEEYREELRQEFLADIKNNLPHYIVVIENDATGIEPKDSYTQMQSFSGLKDLIERDYVLETKIEHYFIFQRIERGRGPG